MDGIELNEKFAGHKVYLIKNNNKIYIKCKKVFLEYDRYLNWKKNIQDNTLGYNLKGVGCNIVEYNDIVEIGCLKDTKAQFKKILKSINKIKRQKKWQ